MNKVFLFHGCFEDIHRSAYESRDTKPFALGISYLDAILRQKGYRVVTKDYMQWKESEFLAEISKILKKFQPDFIGIAMMTMTRVSGYKAIKLIKKIVPNAKIILGGMHPSMMYQQLLENFQIDAVTIGEADETLPELLDAMETKKSLKNIKGIAFMDNKKIFVTKQRELNYNLDALPFPSYDVFMNPKIKHVYMASSRGCPNKCSFCCLHVTSLQRWRPRSAKNVVDEIEYVKKKYPWIEEVDFVDDTLTLDNKRVIEICKDVVKRGLKLRFYCQARIKPVSKEMFYWMEKAGFVEIRFGIETGSPKLLESIHKNVTQEDCFKTFEMLKPFKKIRVVKFLMIGFPGESEETVKETIEFSKKLQKIIHMDFFGVTPLMIYPETEVYNIMKEKGMINDDYWLTNKPCPLFTAEHSEEQLRKWASRIAIESAFDLGILFILKFGIRKLIEAPKYYTRRLIQADILERLRNVV